MLEYQLRNQHHQHQGPQLLLQFLLVALVLEEGLLVALGLVVLLLVVASRAQVH